ncbi:GntR family transcriptional regulator [Pontixanthobacter gangjinensis]|uniref:FCD domain-containing protein n=1 Tax=Pontixanthobacter gangjinensis TaxID=1028742 RepID=A0A6I4SIS3_9SPHN|nr:GntR family transcriptional regulator [Pontixanthobacter gangjinensis]MXO55278.1 FCD domain-containing protein [Pontixanthobacter gangjinensis]
MQYTIDSPQSASSQAAKTLRAMIIDGVIPDGDRINEVHLSQRLQISRTPIREGLGQLVAEGFVEIIPRRGFFACPLNANEFSDLYDLRPMLDPEALLLGGQLTPEEIDALEQSNEVFQNAQPGAEAVNADENFHRLLIARCQNAVLLGVIDNLMARTRRYELALFRETAPVNCAANEHKMIIKALRDQQLQDAAKHLHGNLTSGKGPILDWLATRLDRTKEQS